MPNPMRRFLTDEDGVVSVDWIVMAFGVICLASLAVGTAADGTFGLADSIANSVNERQTHGSDQGPSAN